MDPFEDDPFQQSILSSSSDAKDDEEKLENNVHDLLEQGWFFGAVLTTKPRMLRCYSDPSPSFDLSKNPNSFIRTSSSSSSKKVSGCLVRAPSLPPCLGIIEDPFEQKESSSSSRRSSSKGTSKLVRQLSDQCLIQEPDNKPTCTGKIEGIQEKDTSHKINSKIMAGKPSKHKLVRTPSLPPCIGRQELIEDDFDDSDITMSRLIRQAMPNSTEILPPLHTSKGMIQSSSMPKYKPPRNLKDMGYTNQKNIKKSQGDLESQQVQGFKDLGFTFNKQDLNQNVVRILPGLQDKKKQNKDQEYQEKRPYLSEAWQVQSCAPPISIWATKNSAEDMKVQLKYWARAVASNVQLA